MKKSIFTVLLFSLIALSVQADEFDLMRQRLRESIVLGQTTAPSDPAAAAALKSYYTSLTSQALNYQQTMRKDTTILWNDLPKLHDTPAFLPVHINACYSRLLDMARAWGYPDCSTYHNEQLKEDIRYGLSLLYRYCYNGKSKKQGSWWEWRIGIPWNYGHIVSILYDELTQDEIRQYEEGVGNFTRSFMKHGDLTWANKASICRNVMILGILTSNKADINDALEYAIPAFYDDATPQKRMSAIRKQDNYTRRQRSLRNVSILADKEGLYRDGTFIQHSSIPYIGTYGVEIIQMAGYMQQLLSGTEFVIPEKISEMLPIWINNTYLPAIYHGEMLLMLMGRANASDPYSKARNIALAIMNAAELISDETERTNALATAANIIAHNEHYSSVYSGLSPLPVYIPVVEKAMQLATGEGGDRAQSILWAAGDRVIHTMPTWRAALSMSSNRIGKYESFLTPTARQNTTGWYTGDGMLYLYLPTDLKHYNQYMQDADPYRLPGTTIDVIEREEIQCVQPAYGNPANAPALARSGGATDANLNISTAMMQLVGGASNLTAKKSWFFFDKEVVCLGADINLDANREVITTIENRRFKHPLSLSIGKGLNNFNGVATEQANIKWAALRDICGYYFPAPATLQVRQTKQGNTEIWLSHGNQPQKADYCYVMLPTMDVAQTNSYAAAPEVAILSNDENVQAVRKGDNIYGIHFWKSASIDIDGLNVSADGMAALLVEKEGEELNMFVAEPAWEERKQVITLSGNYRLAEEPADTKVTIKQKNGNTILTLNQHQKLGTTTRLHLLPM